MLEMIGRIEIDVAGLELVDPAEQYVVAPLHEGFADALALLHLPLGLRFVARDELFDWSTLGRYLVATGHPRMETSTSLAGLRRFQRDVVDVFESGDSLVVFPQGSILGIEVAFEPGAMRISRRHERPLLPVVLTGSHRIWEHPYSPTVRFGERISMRVLEPVPADRVDSAAFRRIERTMKRMALDPSMAAPRRFVPERDGWWDDYRYAIDPDFRDVRELVEAHRDPTG